MRKEHESPSVATTQSAAARDANSATRPPMPEGSKQVGPYRLGQVLGRGGMGVVYRAVHEHLEREVALKQIRPELAERSHCRHAFWAEAKIIAQISHPNIVQVYDVLEENGEAWIVMEHVPGPTLSSLLVSGPLPVSRVVTLALEIACGLAAAHALGIVHRDLKASNIKLTDLGQAKVLDFGIAQLVPARAEPPERGHIAGTPQAMSPEQALGHPVDTRSDLFSLGSLLYELLSGVSPFHAEDSVEDTLHRIRNRSPEALSDLDPAIPEELSILVEHLLEKDPCHRPRNIEAAILVLQRLTRRDFDTPKILFVDDEPSFEALIRQRYRRKVRRKALELFFARNGKQALRLLNRHQEIDLVVTDLRMPKMDGLTCLRKLHEISPDLVTVVVSAFGDMSNIRKAMRSGAFDFLIKPVDLDDLEKTRVRALREAQLRSERHWLRRENQILSELNGFAREAFRRSLRQEKGGGPVRFLPDPALRRADSAPLVRIRLENLESLSGSLSAEDLLASLTEFFATLVRACNQYQGSLLEFRHGESLVAFELPGLGNRQANLAARCALELKRWATERAMSEDRPCLRLQIEVDFETDRAGVDPELLVRLESEFGDQLHFAPGPEQTTIAE